MCVRAPFHALQCPVFVVLLFTHTESSKAELQAQRWCCWVFGGCVLTAAYLAAEDLAGKKKEKAESAGWRVTGRKSRWGNNDTEVSGLQRESDCQRRRAAGEDQDSTVCKVLSQGFSVFYCLLTSYCNQFKWEVCTLDLSLVAELAQT